MREPHGCVADSEHHSPYDATTYFDLLLKLVSVYFA